MRCSDPTTITVSKKLATRALCGERLIVRGSLITDKAEVLAEWVRHIQELSTSQAISQIAEAKKKLPELKFPSRMNSNQLLDDEIIMEEIEDAITRGKSSHT